MDSVLILSLFLATSLGTLLLAQRRRRPRGALLGQALRRTAELIGAGLLFWILNVALGAAFVLGLRAAGQGFVSIYILTDISLLVLSLLQGLFFECWRLARATSEGTGR